MTITIDAELEARQRAVAALSEAADHFEVRTWWDGLTEDEREAERAKTRKSLAAGDAGRTRPASEVYARIRARYARR